LLDLMSYVEDTHVSPSASPVRVKAKKTRATSGHGYEKPYAFYDPVTQSLKMYEATCPLAALPSLKKLPPSGMTQNGVLFLQPPWEPITDATGSSLLHTPTGTMNQMSPSMANGKRQSGWWPTPTTQEVEHPDAIINEKGRRIAKNGGTSHSLGLADAVQRWPTPQSNDAKNAVVRHREKSLQVMLGGALATSEPSLIGGRLNPTWVEWLMGFPTGWTDLKDSETP